MLSNDHEANKYKTADARQRLSKHKRNNSTATNENNNGISHKNERNNRTATA
jgi:hypothetical protein